jgi:metal-dependent amidase/aminoacylase/carboxypeptidase family protein
VALATLLLAATSTAGDLDQAISHEAERLGPGPIQIRRWFHQHPELSNRKVSTGREIARRLAALDDEAVIETEPILAAEDFSLNAERVPGFYFFLDVDNPERGWTSNLHTSTFRPDESSIGVGVRAAAALLIDATAPVR